VDSRSPTGLQAFIPLWLGQLTSNLGTQVSLYALGLWLYQRQEQLAAVAAVAIAVQVAKLLVLPLLNRRLPQWPRRTVLLGAHGIASLVTLLLAWALRAGDVQMAPVLAAIAVAAAAEATVQVGFSSLIPRLVPVPSLGRASGLYASWDGAVVMAAPFLGAALVASCGLTGVLLLDGATSLVAFACTALAPWPPAALGPERAGRFDSGAGPQGPASGLRATIRELGQAQGSRHTLRPLALLSSLVAAMLAAVELGFPAWVVSSMGPWRLSAAMAIGGGGFLLGTQLWSRRWGSQSAQQWLAGLRTSLLIQGVVLTAAGLVVFEGLPWIWYGGVGVFAFLVPVVLACLQALWQRAIPACEQPRLFAGRYSLEWLGRLLACLILTVVVDGLLKPAAAWPGWPHWLINAVGSGAGRPAAMALGLVGWAVLVPLLVLWRPLETLGRRMVEED